MLARFKSATSGTGTGYPGPCHILPIESLISIFNHPLVVLILPDSPVAPMKSTRENDVIDVSGGRWGGREVEPRGGNGFFERQSTGKDPGVWLMSGRGLWQWPPAARATPATPATSAPVTAAVVRAMGSESAVAPLRAAGSAA